MSKKTFTAEERRRAIEQFSPKIFYSDRYSGELLLVGTNNGGRLDGRPLLSLVEPREQWLTLSDDEWEYR